MYICSRYTVPQGSVVWKNDDDNYSPGYSTLGKPKYLFRKENVHDFYKGVLDLTENLYCQMAKRLYLKSG